MGPKKHLGQHFLTSPSYARRIAEAVPACSDDHILEIGPGRGALSIFLKDRFPTMHLVEIDAEAVDRLRVKLGECKCTIHIADVLAFDFGEAGFPLHVAGNLPYSIGAMIIKKTLMYGGLVRSCTFMVQREVAERIVSPPHRKTNGFLAVFCGYFGIPKLLFNVPPGAFFPRPNVDSSVFQVITDKKAFQRLPREQWEDFFAFVSTGFGMRRKKLSNSFGRCSSDRQRCESILEDIGMNPLSRPEDLGVHEWIELYKQWKTVS